MPATGERGPGPGLIREDGSVIYLVRPAPFTEDNKLNLLNSRPAIVLSVDAAEVSSLAMARHDVLVAQRETFPGPDAVSTPVSGPEL